MSFRRVIIWTCNKCGLEVEKTGYGLPPGWIYLPGNLIGGEIEHRCKSCEKIRKDKKN